MKKIIAIILSVVMLSLPMSTYSKAEGADEKQVKVGIVTGTMSSDKSSYEAAKKMVALYKLKNKDKNSNDEIKHFVLPANSNGAKKVVDKIVADEDMNAVVFSGNDKNMLGYIKDIKAKRNDMLLMGADLNMSIEEMSENLNLSFVPTEISSGKDTAMLAKEMGAEAFVVYYSDKDLKENKNLSKKIEEMKKECANQNIEFAEVKVADINSKEDEYKVKKFISEDIEKQIYKYGKNVTLYGTNSTMDDVIVKRGIKERLIIAETSDGCIENDLNELYRTIMKTAERGNFRGNVSLLAGKNSKYNMDRRVGGLLMPNDTFAIYSAVDTAIAALEQDVNENKLCMASFIEKSISEKDGISGAFRNTKSGIKNVKVTYVDQVIY